MFRLEKDSLHIVDTLNATPGLKMDVLCNFPNERLLYFSESEISAYNTGSILSVIGYQDSIIIRRFNNDSYRYSQNVYLLKIDDTLFFNNEFQANETIDTFYRYGIDEFFSRRKITPKDYNKIVIAGYPAMQRMIPEYFTYYYLWGNFDSLRIYRPESQDVITSRNATNFPAAFVQMPNYLMDEGCDQFVVIANNDRYCIGVLTGEIRSKEKDKPFSALIFDKKNEKWHEFTHDSIRARIMNWEDWIYGTVVYPKKSQSLDTAYVHLYNSKYDRDFGEPNFFNYDYPGALFLYHIPTAKYIEWATGDPDSEVILIDHGRIYYRVFDELKEVKLDLKRNNIDWSTDHVIMKNKKIIPNVHWIFFAPKMKVKEIWAEKEEK